MKKKLMRRNFSKVLQCVKLEEKINKFTRPARAQGQAARARGPSCWGTMSQYEWAYRDRHATWPLGCVAIRARHGQGKRHDTVQEAAIRCRKLRYAQQRPRAGRGDTMRDTASQAYDTAGAGPATRRCARCLGAVHAAYTCNLGSGCAPSAPNPVLDSVHCFSHCLDHCS